jgi:hypothetical protein
MDTQYILGLAAVIIGAYSYIPYLIGMKAGRVKPHVFTWFIWGLVTIIAYVAQASDMAGPGSWVMLFTGIVCFFIAACALKVGEKQIVRSDWVCFFLALSAIPLWMLTNSPLLSVILICIIDLIGFIPTFRKSWSKPWDEDWQVYLICAAKFAVSLFAINNISLITTLYPIVLVVLNGGFFVMLMIRRNALSRAKT